MRDVDESIQNDPDGREEKRTRRRDRRKMRGVGGDASRASDGRPGILRLAFKIRNRREAGESLMTLAGPGPRWRNGREVEVRGRRRAQTAVSTDAPDLPHAAL